MTAIVQNLSAARRAGGVSLLLFILALTVYFLPADFTTALQYDRSRILSGELYRLLTCHWTHFTRDHLLWDSITFLLLACACERRDRARFLATIVLSTVLVSSAILLFLPTLQSYRGLSALDSALFALLAISTLNRSLSARHWTSVAMILLLLSCFVAKTIIEISTGRCLFVSSDNAGFTPVPLAHFVGFATGALSAIIPFRAAIPCSRPAAHPVA